MALENLFKLQRLEIKAYEKAERVDLPTDSWTAMFNPASVSRRHENKFSKPQGINTNGRAARYSHSPPSELKLDLVLDDTCIDEDVIENGTQSVAEQIEHFLELCFYMDGDIHEPKFLKIQWGEGGLKDFDCRLLSVDIEYKAFDRNGAPLHAILKTAFVEDLEFKKRLRKPEKSSPDLTHTRVVKSGDTLPLLSKAIYGSSQYYLRLAQANNLDDFRNLTPGQTIIFPPLDKQPRAKG